MADKKRTRFEMVVGAVDKFSAPFRRFNQRVEDSTRGLREFGEASRNLGREAGFGRLTGSAKKLGGLLRGVWGEARKLTSQLTGMAGKASLLFGAAGGGAMALVKNTATAGDAAAKAAQRAGVGVETWQEFAHAAELSDVSSGQLEKSLSKLSKQAIAATTGGKQQALWFKRAGISVKDAGGKLKSTDQLFMDVAASVKKLSDAGQKAKALDLAKGIFGDNMGGELMPMLNAGADGLRDLRREAHELGLVLSGEDAAAAGAFNDSLSRVKGGLRGLGFMIGREFMPIATEVLVAFKGWIGANRELIRSKVREWALKLQACLPKLRDGFLRLGKGVGQFVDRADRFASSVGGWDNVLKGVAALMAGPLFLSILSAGKAFIGLGAAIMTTPLGLILALAAGAYLIYKNWDGLKVWFDKFFPGVRQAFERNWIDGIVALLDCFNPVLQISKAVNELIKYFFGIDLMTCGESLIGSLGRGIERRWGTIVTGFKSKLASFTSWMPDWIREELGIGPVEDRSGASSASAAKPGFSSTLDAAGMATQAGLAAVTRVEREELKVTLVPPDGWEARVSGGKPDSGLDLSGPYIGHMAWG